MSKHKARLISIDALRGIAAVVVLLYHARDILWVGVSDTWSRYGWSFNFDTFLAYLSAPIVFGSLAVNLFFVLSGYCIHRRGARQLASNSNAQISLFQFFLRRVWRLYPTYIFALVLTAVVDTFLISSQFLESTLPNSHSPFTFFMSLLSLQGIAAPYFGSNGVFWTLSVEIHFYIVYPLLFYISQKYGPYKTLCLTLVISSTYMMCDYVFSITSMLPYRDGFNPIFLPYLFMWCFGFYIAEVEAKRAVLPIRMTLIAIFSFVVTLFAYFIELRSIVNLSSALAFGGLLQWSLSEQGERFWNHSIGRLFAWIGSFSYSLYALHVPLILAVKSLSMSSNEEAFTIFYPVIIISALVVGLAWIMFLFVEKWTLRPLSLIVKS